MADQLRGLPRDDLYDICGYEELDPMRGEERFTDLFGHCPPLPDPVE